MELADVLCHYMTVIVPLIMTSGVIMTVIPELMERRTAGATIMVNQPRVRQNITLLYPVNQNGNHGARHHVLGPSV